MTIRAVSCKKGLERVRALIVRLAPVGICDTCVAEKLKLERRSEAGALARQLAGVDGFERQTGASCMCGTTRVLSHLQKGLS